MGWLISLDPLARDLAVDVLIKAVDIQEKRDRHLAQMIIEELAKAMS